MWKGNEICSQRSKDGPRHVRYLKDGRRKKSSGRKGSNQAPLCFSGQNPSNIFTLPFVDMITTKGKRWKTVTPGSKSLEKAEVRKRVAAGTLRSPKGQSYLCLLYSKTATKYRTICKIPAVHIIALIEPRSPREGRKRLGKLSLANNLQHCQFYRSLMVNPGPAAWLFHTELAFVVN